MVPRHTVQALEALAHVRSSGSQIDSRCSSPAEHAQTPSSTRTNCSRAPVSNPRPTSIRRPPLSTTASALPVAAMGAGAWPETSTASRALRPAGACRARRFRYRLRLLNDKPRSRQNSLRLNPLDSYSAINCSTSCRLRRRRTSNTCFSLMSLLHHQFHHSNRWFPLTLTTVHLLALDSHLRTAGLYSLLLSAAGQVRSRHAASGGRGSLPSLLHISKWVFRASRICRTRSRSFCNRGSLPRRPRR